MPDYPPENNEQRVARRQQLTHDAGVTPREIQDAVRDFTRRATDRIEARALPQIASNVPAVAEPVREVRVETVTLEAGPLVVAQPQGGSATTPPATVPTTTVLAVLVEESGDVPPLYSPVTHNVVVDDP